MTMGHRLHWCGLLALICAGVAAGDAPDAPVPAHLKGHEELFRKDPRVATQAWFRDAKFGLFVHYGLVSLLPGGKTGSRPGDPSADELRKRYTAEKFDANALADLAVAAGMKYICFTPYHGGGPYHFITYEHRFRAQSEFKFVPDEVKKKLADKTVEIVTTLQLDRKDGKGTKMWFNVEGAYHRDADEIWRVLGEARRDGCNLMVNTGLLGDGSVPAVDAETLREVGRRLRESGFPVSREKGSVSKEGEDR